MPRKFARRSPGRSWVRDPQPIWTSTPVSQRHGQPPQTIPPLLRQALAHHVMQRVGWRKARVLRDVITWWGLQSWSQILCVGDLLELSLKHITSWNILLSFHSGFSLNVSQEWVSVRIIWLIILQITAFSIQVLHCKRMEKIGKGWRHMKEVHCPYTPL